MAKIKRIVTSGMEGRETSDRHEPNSYLIGDQGEIVYHTGQEPYQVLKPGTLYGANHDSGDGFGRNTIKLIPDDALGTDQYLIVDPTAPNHIHIRAGGVQDQSNADLIIGAEKTYIKVSDGSNDIQIKTHEPVGEGGENEYYWSFGSDGTLYGPAMGGLVVTNLFGAGQDYPLVIGSNDRIMLGATNGEFLNDADNPNNQIATLGDIQDPLSNSTPWTPVISGTGFTQTSNPATGNYYNIGNMVFVNLYIPFTNVTNFGTGQYSVNLPLNAARHTDIYGGSIHNTGSPTTFYSIKGHLEPNSNSMSLWYISSTALDQPITHAAPITLNVTDLIHMSFIYEAASE